MVAGTGFVFVAFGFVVEVAVGLVEVELAVVPGVEVELVEVELVVAFVVFGVVEGTGFVDHFVGRQIKVPGFSAAPKIVEVHCCRPTFFVQVVVVATL